MNILKCFATLMLAYFAVALAANEKEMLVRVRPITRAQYETIMKINDGKPVIPEGRLINSAITGLAGLAAGFQLGKYLPNIFGGNNHNSKGSSVLGGYPLCTINTNDVTGRQNDAAPYLNVDELTNTLVQQNDSSYDIPGMNCILVLDDGKDKPSSENSEQPITTTTKSPPIVKPIPTHTPTNHPPYIHPPSHLPYPPFYPGYPYYPYPPTYLPPQLYPIPYPPHVKYPINNNDNDFVPEQDYDEDTLPSLESAVKLQTFLMNKLQAISGLTSSTTTTKKPTKKPSGRPTFRPHPRPTTHPAHYSNSHRINFNENFDEDDDSIDYIEVSKKFHH